MILRCKGSSLRARFLHGVLLSSGIAGGVLPARGDPRIVRETRPLDLRFDARVFRSRSHKPVDVVAPAQGWRAGGLLDFRVKAPCASDEILQVDLVMPEHGHGPALDPEVALVARCEWEVRAVKLHMPGWWRGTLVFLRDGRVSDGAIVNLLAL